MNSFNRRQRFMSLIFSFPFWLDFAFSSCRFPLLYLKKDHAKNNWHVLSVTNFVYFLFPPRIFPLSYFPRILKRSKLENKRDFLPNALLFWTWTTGQLFPVYRASWKMDDWKKKHLSSLQHLCTVCKGQQHPTEQRYFFDYFSNAKKWWRKKG